MACAGLRLARAGAAAPRLQLRRAAPTCPPGRHGAGGAARPPLGRHTPPLRWPVSPSSHERHWQIGTHCRPETTDCRETETERDSRRCLACQRRHGFRVTVRSRMVIGKQSSGEHVELRSPTHHKRERAKVHEWTALPPQLPPLKTNTPSWIPATSGIHALQSVCFCWLSSVHTIPSAYPPCTVFTTPHQKCSPKIQHDLFCKQVQLACFFPSKEIKELDQHRK